LNAVWKYCTAAAKLVPVLTGSMGVRNDKTGAGKKKLSSSYVSERRVQNCTSATIFDTTGDFCEESQGLA
jgi:hypothetical protein